MVLTLENRIEALEKAEAQYLFDRGDCLQRLKGNPYKAHARKFGEALAFCSTTNTSPMNNRICGVDPRVSALSSNALDWFRTHRAPLHVPITGDDAEVTHAAHLTGGKILRGWTHGQFAASIGDFPSVDPKLETFQFSVADINVFVDIHSAAFRTGAKSKDMACAMFGGLIEAGKAEAYGANINGDCIAIGLVYFADNGVAYLATAATTRSARKSGAHSALILKRIQAAKERGADLISSTALLNSQSKRNLQRMGLKLSHRQTLLSVPL